MGSSIKAGVAEAIKKDSHAVLLMVCDQPLISAQHLNALIRVYADATVPIVTSLYEGGPGVPALFDRSLFDGLLQLPDDQGAKKILLQNVATSATVSWPEGVIDIDTQDDLERMRKNNSDL